jgi:F-type H+-transporting ATPase subunit b
LEINLMGLVQLSQLLTHIAGFLIALWILKKYAWGPVLKMLDERRDTINEDLRSAQRTRDDAKKDQEELRRQLKEIDATARAKTLEAINEARQIAAEIKEGARKDGKDLVERARQEIEREKVKAQVELKNTVVNLAIGGAEKLLSERMDEERNKRLVLDFIEAVGESGGPAEGSARR